jgi:hypothetical protein
MSERVSDIYSKAYASVSQWPETETEKTITTAGVDDDPFNKEGDGKLIFVTFDGSEVRFRINKTNAQLLAAAFGEEIRKWKGKRVNIWRTKATIRGQKAWQGLIEPVSNNKK